MDRHLLDDDKPSEYFESLSDMEVYTKYPFTMLGRLKDTHQSPIHHPEGNVWNHTMLVIDEAAKVKSKSSNNRVFMWPALLHDIGKPDTTRTRRGKITSYDHDKLGAIMSKEFLDAGKVRVGKSPQVVIICGFFVS
ncbi:MAG: HDIG domain-containing protein [Clostridiaceae bacterium]|nr:HDIG domain-containing protein [Clostridiaceae bacterium]